MIMINLDVMMAKRKKGLTELAGEVDLHAGKPFYPEK